MQDKIVVSLDMMGGSNAPTSTIEGACAALEKLPRLYLLLYGDADLLAPFVHRLAPFAGRYDFVHTTSVIGDNEQPVKALKHGKESSMRRAIDAVKGGIANACVSSGNTGALMVMSKMVLGELPGIKRPAIVSTIPHMYGKTIVLDLGANAECDENNLYQFALMGSIYAKIILQKNDPTVGLLNVGVESIKGTGLQKKTHLLLEESDLNYQGYVEGCDVSKGVVDVVVTDGFTGNVMLKFGEGLVKLVLDIVKNAFRTNLWTKIAGLMMKKYLRASLAIIDPRELNGAMFIGVNGIVIKSHGSSDGVGVASAISVAYDLAEQEVNHAIKAELKIACHESGAHAIVDKIKKTLGMG